MSACYSVIIEADIKDVKSAIKDIDDYIKRTDGTTARFNLNEVGYNTDSLSGVIRAFIPPSVSTYDEAQQRFTGCFNASYGWIEVLCDLLKILAKYNSDGHFATILNDNDEISFSSGAGILLLS